MIITETGKSAPIDVMSKEMHEWAMTPDEVINSNKRKYCKKCKYRGYASGDGTCALICNYISITNKRRGCSPIDCKKFEKGKKITTRRQLGES